MQLVQGSIETTHPESWNIVGSKVSRATKYETDDSGMTRKVSYDVTYEISFDRFKITFIGDIINGYYFSWECANDQSLAGQTITVIKCIYVSTGQGCYTLFINLKAANESLNGYTVTFDQDLDEIIDLAMGDLTEWSYQLPDIVVTQTDGRRLME